MKMVRRHDRAEPLILGQLRPIQQISRVKLLETRRISNDTHRFSFPNGMRQMLLCFMIRPSPAASVQEHAISIFDLGHLTYRNISLVGSITRSRPEPSGIFTGGW